MAKKKKVNTYDARHLKSLQTSVNEMSRLFDEAQNDLINLGLLSSSMARGEEFYSFSDFPELNKLVNARLKELRAESVTLLKNTERRAWDIANAKNDALVKSVAAMCGIKEEAFSGCMSQNLSALSAFQTRKIGGMGLSARVWNIAKDFKTDVELALSVGMKDGASAARMTRDVKHLLKNPNALFRRVRDKATGELVPSKAMRAYHPGRGVYKSAYKNALRLTATEGNMAYRTAEHERWQSMPFVVGITIQISNNHPQPDICNDLAGTYPKDFKFVGWHPFCRCFATPKLASVSDMQKYMEDEDAEEYKPNPEDVVTEVPKGFKDWVAANSDRIAKAGEGKLPYFLRDNKWAWEGDGKSAWATEITRGWTPPSEDVRHETWRKELKAMGYTDETQIQTKIDNWKALEEALGIKKGAPMAAQEADIQSANPNFFKHKSYQINCATCAPTYALRRQGFNITARANTIGSLNRAVARHWSTVWSSPTISYMQDYLSKHKLKQFTAERYKDYINEVCKEEGIYEIALTWKGRKYRHATIIERTKDGIFNVEPQINRNGVVYKSLDDLIKRMSLIPYDDDGITRIDNILFNSEWASIFNVVK